jgi:hypothetical protein
VAGVHGTTVPQLDVVDSLLQQQAVGVHMRTLLSRMVAAVLAHCFAQHRA